MGFLVYVSRGEGQYLGVIVMLVQLKCKMSLFGAREWGRVCLCSRKRHALLFIANRSIYT